LLSDNFFELLIVESPSLIDTFKVVESKALFTKV
jgi:hypothetical protein